MLGFYRSSVRLGSNILRKKSFRTPVAPVSVTPVPGNPVSGNPMPGNQISVNPVSGNPVSVNPVSGNPVSGNPVSGNPVSGNPVSVTPISGNQISGAQAIYDAMIDHGVEHVAMYSGGAIMPLIDLFTPMPNESNYRKGKKGIAYTINNHEQNCGHTATGYAKSSGKTGVAIVTSGPGLTNMVTPILDAMNDSTPLVVFSGQVPYASVGTRAFQECPATDITRPCTKWSYCAKPGDSLYGLTQEAFRVAQSGKPGVVHIDLPKCVISNPTGTGMDWSI